MDEKLNDKIDDIQDTIDDIQENIDNVEDRIDNVEDKIKETDYLKVGPLAIISFIIGIIGLHFFSDEFPKLSAYFGMFGNVGAGLGFWYFYYRIVFKLNTLYEIKKGNTAVALFSLGIMAIIAAAIFAT